MARHVALLRAINIGERRLKMDRLRGIFTSLGYDNVNTYIASGNVIFDTDQQPTTADIEAWLASELEFEVPTFLRSSHEFLSVLTANPFPNGAQVEVSFLPAKPTRSNALELERSTTGSDSLAVIGREVFWSHQGDTQASTHSEARVARTLGMHTTRRSLRTIQRIADKYLN